MAKRPKTVKEKIYVAIKKSDEPLSKLQLKLKIAKRTLTYYLPILVKRGCIEEMPAYYADIMAMMSSPTLQKRDGRKVKFYRRATNHSCDFCEVFN